MTINELLKTEKFGGRKWPGEVLRLAMLKTHYRQPIDWTVKALEEAEKAHENWYDVSKAFAQPSGTAQSIVLDAACRRSQYAAG